MFVDQKETLLGVKTFFVLPEMSLLPEEYLRSFFLRGFETYFLDDDPYLALEAKIRVLFSLFPEVILFFNIDREVHGIDWPILIGNLQKQYGERAMIGVLYRKRGNLEEIRALERQYLYEIGITCGCIPIEYQKAKNLFILTNVLIANQANGRRKFLRAICSDSCKVNLTCKDHTYKGLVRDISISHFSCIFVGDIPELEMYERFGNIQLSLRGVLCKVAGILCLKRVVGNDKIHVFVFRRLDEREGLDNEFLIKINSFIFDTLSANIQGILKKGFETERTCRLIRKE